MGKLRVVKAGPMASIQDFGRFGFRRYGIPQSGAMDRDFMIAANRQAGNPENYPVIEFALAGMELEALEEAVISVIGAALKVNGEHVEKACKVSAGDSLKISAPGFVYGYMGMGGKLAAQEDFGSISTYERAGFGGIAGRRLKAGDMLIVDGECGEMSHVDIPQRTIVEVAEIRIMKGPEWDLLKELPSLKTFQVDATSDRMGIRLTGAKLDCDYQEIASSAVIPGTIQLPPDGQPIILMNDCQTTGGYPRIGKVMNEDLGKLAQVRPGKAIRFRLV
ncbi:MAG: biotin-dependent carboxyltransferase family protein [Ekhidna sp.]|uniref:5-oxoprolinase subunit C family protein n=1 Tax=Ekhidna sp. TaxID=2608089 RepID=UPI0032EAA478